jgi:hypothetical protein
MEGLNGNAGGGSASPDGESVRGAAGIAPSFGCGVSGVVAGASSYGIPNSESGSVSSVGAVSDGALGSAGGIKGRSPAG